jgi:ABC-type multidrug transport system fused ATPase/permease subunit
VDATDAELTRLEGRTAAASALGAGLMSVVTGLTVWGVLLLGVAATGAGALTRVPLAVLTLTALAAFEAVTALPAAAVQLGQARVAAGRIAAVTDTPDPVRDPGRPRALPPGPFGIQLRDATVRYRPDGPPALDPPTRRALTADLLHATQDRSVLFITHQPDGLDQVDHIVVLDHGRVAEQGTHQQLRHAGGPYQRMWDSEHQRLVPCSLPGTTVPGG